MADVFISYRQTPARRAIVRRLATALRTHDLSVWWDHGLEAGRDYEREILRELQQARVIVPLWCTESVVSRWVLEEARTGLGRDVLLPVLLQNIVPPVEFAKIQAHDLVGWDGAIDSPRLLQFVSSICQRLGRTPSVPSDLLDDLRGLKPVEALDATSEMVGGESFTVYSAYRLFGNDLHAEVIRSSSGPIDLTGISLLAFHREQQLGDAIGKRIGEGLPVRVLMVGPDNAAGLSQFIQDPETWLPRILGDIEQSFAAWSELARQFPNVSCRRLSQAVVRQIATITPAKTVITPYWYAISAPHERPTLVCKSNSVFYKLVRAEFEAQWAVAM